MIVIRDKAFTDKETIMLLENLFAAPKRNLMDMPKSEARLILAVRSWVLLKSAHEDPLPRIIGYLSSSAAAMRFGVLMETLQQIWPQAFAIHRPCCGVASLDEALLAQMVQLGSIDARPAFDALLQEMICSDHRNLLYMRVRNFSRCDPGINQATCVE
jgi:hypothetical protein